MRFEFLLFDVTSTFFERRAEANPLAARGYSRDRRPDCSQVCNRTGGAAGRRERAKPSAEKRHLPAQTFAHLPVRERS